MVYIALIIGIAPALTAQPDKEAYHAVANLNYYTDEATGEIAVFVPPGREGLDVKVDLVFEFQFINRGYAVGSQGISLVPFSLELLREGNNELTVSFYENDKWIDSRKVNVKLLAAIRPMVRIDRAAGCLLLENGPLEPNLAKCPWSADQDMLEALKADGFNTVAPFGDGKRPCKGARLRFLDRCADAGLLASYDLGDLPGLWQEKGSPGKMTRKLGKEIASFRAHHAILCWQVTPGATEKASDTGLTQQLHYIIVSADPYRPVGVMFSSPGQALNSWDSADMIIYNGNESDLKELREHFRMEKPVFPLEY